MENTTKKHICNLLLKEKTKLGEQLYLLKYELPPFIEEIYAGQFAEFNVQGLSGGLLRRPLSIHSVDWEKREISFLVQVVGENTAHLCQLERGTNVEVILPLGKGFTLPQKEDKALLIGGGVGIAPLFFLGEEIKKMGMMPTFLLGGRGNANLVRLQEFNSLGDTYITTEDGTLGEKGFVTQHSILKEEGRFDKIYVCGPTPMMRAVVEYAKREDIWCEVSLENKMACGIGVCLCCVQKTRNGHQCVCSEGPVFNASVLEW